MLGKAWFGPAYEGPPGCVHGGYIAAAFDELLGCTQTMTGAPGMTANLSIDYRTPTPLETELSFVGVVTKVDWTNPHVWFYINVKDKDTGKVTNWGAEMGPPHGLQRQGWRRETLKIGEEVTVTGSRAKNGTNRMNARSVIVSSTGGKPQELDAVSSQGQNP